MADNFSMFSKMCLRSNRIYLDDANICDVLCQDIDDMNTAIHYTYNTLFDMEYYNKTISEDSIFLHLKNKYSKLNTYFLNSALNTAKGDLKSQMELLDLRIKETEEKNKKY